MPDYLYHYTNLNSFELILKNRTIRLNSLKNMDDAEEIVTANSPYLGKYCFVSSWTELKEENIPFWGLYTEKMTGVRLKMQKCPFEKHTYHLSYYNSGQSFESYCPAEIINGNLVMYWPSIPFLRKVEYTEDECLLYPSLFSYFYIRGDRRFEASANFNSIGQYKRSCWEFQSEWRYSLLFLPKNENGDYIIDFNANDKSMPFWYCDLPISEEAFCDIEIMTGPRMSDNDKMLLQDIVNKYCPSAKIVNSSLKIN